MEVITKNNLIEFSSNLATHAEEVKVGFKSIWADDSLSELEMKVKLLGEYLNSQPLDLSENWSDMDSAKSNLLIAERRLLELHTYKDNIILVGVFSLMVSAAGVMVFVL